MKKQLLILISVLVLLSGCAAKTTGETSSLPPAETNADTAAGEYTELSVEDKFESISFTFIDGCYTRNVLQEDTEFTEMFVLEKDSFVRISGEENEQEVFSYNYKTTEFTYIYFIADEKAVKVVYNINKDKVIEDDDDFIELLKTDAIELKIYFESLLEEAGIELEEL